MLAFKSAICSCPDRCRPLSSFATQVTQVDLTNISYNLDPPIQPPRALAVLIHRLRSAQTTCLCLPTHRIMSSMGSDLEMPDQSMGNESDTSGVSFHPDCDGGESDDEISGSTTQTSPEIRPFPDRPAKSSRIPKASARDRVCPDTLPDFSDDPDDDTDEDIANVPLDYGRSDRTLVRRARIEQRWHK